MDVKYERYNYGNSTLLGMLPGVRTDVRHVTAFFQVNRLPNYLRYGARYRSDGGARRKF